MTSNPDINVTLMWLGLNTAAGLAHSLNYPHLLAGFVGLINIILARVVRLKNENGRKFTRKKKWRRVGLHALSRNTGVALRILHYIYA